MTRFEQLMAAAEADAKSLHTITRADGTSYIGAKGHGIAEDGPVQAYAVPVTARTRAMQEHYRITFYLKVDGKWKRSNRAVANRQLAGTGNDGSPEAQERPKTGE